MDFTANYSLARSINYLNCKKHAKVFKVENDALRTSAHRSLITAHRSLITAHRSLITDYRTELYISSEDFSIFV